MDKQKIEEGKIAQLKIALATTKSERDTALATATTAEGEAAGIKAALAKTQEDLAESRRELSRAKAEAQRAEREHAQFVEGLRATSQAQLTTMLATVTERGANLEKVIALVRVAAPDLVQRAEAAAAIPPQ